MRYQLELKPHYPVGSKLKRKSDDKIFTVKKAPDNISWIGYIMNTNEFIDLIHTVTQFNHARYLLKSDDSEIMQDEDEINKEYNLLLL